MHVDEKNRECQDLARLCLQEGNLTHINLRNRTSWMWKWKSFGIQLQRAGCVCLRLLVGDLQVDNFTLFITQQHMKDFHTSKTLLIVSKSPLCVASRWCAACVNSETSWLVVDSL